MEVLIGIFVGINIGILILRLEFLHSGCRLVIGIRFEDGGLGLRLLSNWYWDRNFVTVIVIGIEIGCCSLRWGWYWD